MRLLFLNFRRLSANFPSELKLRVRAFPKFDDVHENLQPCFPDPQHNDPGEHGNVAHMMLWAEASFMRAGPRDRCLHRSREEHGKPSKNMGVSMLWSDPWSRDPILNWGNFNRWRVRLGKTCSSFHAKVKREFKSGDGKVETMACSQHLLLDLVEGNLFNGFNQHVWV